MNQSLIKKKQTLKSAKPVVLFIDDEVDNLVSFKYQFRDYFSIITLNSAVDAFEVLEKNEVEVIISDQRMPDMTGTEFFEKIADKYPRIPRLILTGYSDAEAIVDSINKAKIFYYLQKPWNENHMILILGNAIESYRLQKKNNILIDKINKAEEDILKLAKAIEKSPIGVLITSPEGIIEYVNNSQCKLTGYTNTELKGQSPEIFYSIEQNPELYDDLWSTIKSGKTWKGQLLNKTKNGELFWCEMTIISFKNENGEIENFISYSEDISERKEMILNLENALKQAKESDLLKSAFLANMSHEIRTPMNGILGFSDLLNDTTLTDLVRANYISIIKKSGLRMLNLVNNLIDISKIESGQTKVINTEFNLDLLLRDVFNFFEEEAKSKKLQLTLNIEQAQEDRIIYSDRFKINDIITNLVKNALKFTDKGSLSFGYTICDNLIEFFVSDTGIGIPEDRKSAIFDRFVQADVLDSRADQGAGLGLSISKAYVELLGGAIQVKSSENFGSTFNFTIPLVQKNSDKKNLVDLKLGDYRGGVKGDMNVLIAEDDEVSRMYIENIMQEYCRDIKIAETGAKAVDVCKNNPDIDLILMDIKMPEMSGYMATKEIRKFNKNVCIVAQTAYAQIGDKEKMIDVGCDYYISKPINRKELHEIINSFSKRK